MVCVQTRVAGEEDIPSLMGWISQFYEEEGLDWCAAEGRPALVRLLGEARLGFVEVGFVGAELVGYGVLTYNFDLECGGVDAFITELWVRPPWRRQGVARALLEAVQRRARLAGVRAVHLQVRPENAAARALYASMGFERVPRETWTRKLD